MDTEHEVASLQWAEIALSRLLSVHVPTRCMIDVGAHVGTTLEPFLAAGWEVHAFEPLEANRRQLVANYPGAPRLSVRPEAVSNASSTRAFHLALNLDGSLHEYHHSLEDIGEDAWHRKGPAIAVTTVSLDDLISRREIPPHAGFLKIDTEGHDLAVLRGAAQLTCDVVSVEYWGDSHPLGKSPSPAGAMIELLQTRGYADYIALCHEQGGIVTRYTSLDGVCPDSWGNIFFFKNAALFQRIVDHREWRFLLDMSGECQRLRAELLAKEAVIHEVDAARKLNEATARQRLILLEQLHTVAAERLAVIERYHAAFDDLPHWKKMLADFAGLYPDFTKSPRARGAA